MTNEMKIWLIAKNILDNHGYMVDNISIHEHEENFDCFMKIYCSEGYCWELSKEVIEQEDITKGDSRLLATSDDFEYLFSEPWEGFNESGIEKAIEILSRYGVAE